MRLKKIINRLASLTRGNLRIFHHLSTGPAFLSALILPFVAIFLFVESRSFFPLRHAQLNEYRRTGLEYSDLIDDACRSYQATLNTLEKSLVEAARWPSRDIDERLAAFSAARALAETQLGAQLLILNDATRQRNSASTGSIRQEKLDKLIGQLETELTSRQAEIETSLTTSRFLGLFRLKRSPLEELSSLDPDQQEPIVKAVLNHLLPGSDEPSYVTDLKKQQLEIRNQSRPPACQTLESVSQTLARLQSPFEEIRSAAMTHSLSVRKRALSNAAIPELVESEVSTALKSQPGEVRSVHYGRVLETIAEAEFFEEFARIFYLETFSNLIRDQSTSHYDQLDPTLRTRIEGILEGSTGKRGEFLELLRSNETELGSFPSAVPADAMDGDLRYLLFDLTRLSAGTDDTTRRLAEACHQFIIPFPFAEEADKLRQLSPEFQLAIDKLQGEGQDAFDRLYEIPAIKSPQARHELEKFRKDFIALTASLEQKREEIQAWRHDSEWTWSETFRDFSQGDEWNREAPAITRFGIASLISNTLLVTLTAILLLIPIATIGAFYTSELASFRQRNVILPAMRLFSNTPTVVVGLFGLILFGDSLRDLNQVPFFQGLALSDENLNLVLAGGLVGMLLVPNFLLRSFAILQEVPSLLREGALSLGCSNLHLALRLALPMSLRSFLALLLIAISRALGATIILLMLAGDRIFGQVRELPGRAAPVSDQTLTTAIARDFVLEAAPQSVQFHGAVLLAFILFLFTVILSGLGQQLTKGTANRQSQS